ncbi:MAG: hypothetical protein K2K27_04000 [Muribaculaceae bacterium]|nr:hypothetical protein [Muribaculaceae bacterium]
MSNLMTRGERRGLIVLLALLTVIVGVSIYDRGVKTSVKTSSVGSIDSVVSVMADTLNISKSSKKRLKRVKKTREKRQSVPERSPLDEIIPSN